MSSKKKEVLPTKEEMLKEKDYEVMDETPTDQKSSDSILVKKTDQGNVVPIEESEIQKNAIDIGSITTKKIWPAWNRSMLRNKTKNIGFVSGGARKAEPRDNQLGELSSYQLYGGFFLTKFRDDNMEKMDIPQGYEGSSLYVPKHIGKTIESQLASGKHRVVLVEFYIKPYNHKFADRGCLLGFEMQNEPVPESEMNVYAQKASNINMD